MQKENARRQPSASHNTPNTPPAYHDSPIDRILSRLDGVRETAPGQWMALCPAHKDKNPSLSIREVEDQTVLLKCFAGCDISDVLAAIGLTLSDLFDNPPADRNPLPRYKRRPPIRDAMTVMCQEAWIVLHAAEAVRRGDLTAGDDMRLCEAVGRIQRIAEVYA